jgi:hypothetical protein
MSNRFINPVTSFSDAAGIPYGSATAVFYLAGTTTPILTYSDVQLNNQNLVTVEALADGTFPQVFFPDGISVKAIFKDKNGNEIDTFDNVSGQQIRFPKPETVADDGTIVVKSSLIILSPNAGGVPLSNMQLPYGPFEGNVVEIRIDGDPVTIKSLGSGGNIQNNGNLDRRLTSLNQIIRYLYTNSRWEETSYSDNQNFVGTTNISAARIGAGQGGSDAAIFQPYLDAGYLIELNSNTQYNFESGVTITHNNSGFIGDGTPTIYGSAAHFTNTNLSNQFGTDACFIYAHGLLTAPYTPIDNPILSGFKIQSEVSGGRSINAVAVRNADNPKVKGLNISGFPVSKGIQLDSITGKSEIMNNKIHDFYDNTNWGAGSPQITGIQVDNNLVNSVPSSFPKIEDNFITDLTVGSTFKMAHGYQTDGINVANPLTITPIVCDNYQKNCGEGYDIWGKNGIIQNNYSQDCFYFNFKLVNGAQHHLVTGNKGYNGGIANLVLAGSGTTSQGCEYNTIIGNDFSGVDPNNLSAAGEPGFGTTACVKIENNGSNGTTLPYPNHNLLLNNNCNPGPHGKYAYANESGDITNQWLFNPMVAGSVAFIKNDPNQQSGLRYTENTRIKATLSGVQSIPNTTWTKVAFATENYDTLSEYDPSGSNYKYTCKLPGSYRFDARVLFDGAFTAGTKFRLALYRNGSEFATSKLQSASTTSATLTVSTSQNFLQGDTMEVYVWHDDAGTGNLNISAGVYSEFTVATESM